MLEHTSMHEATKRFVHVKLEEGPDPISGDEVERDTNSKVSSHEEGKVQTISPLRGKC